MRIIKRSTLKSFWARHPETEQALKHWFQITSQASWLSGQDVLNDFPKARPLNNERVRFEIAGGNYRLIVAIKYSASIVWIKFIGTHAEYDRIDALSVDQN